MNYEFRQIPVIEEIRENATGEVRKADGDFAEDSKDGENAVN